MEMHEKHSADLSNLLTHTYKRIAYNGAFAAGNAQRALLFCWINVNKMFASSVISQNNNYP